MGLLSFYFYFFSELQIDMYMYIYIYIYVCMYVCMYVCIYECILLIDSVSMCTCWFNLYENIGFMFVFPQKVYDFIFG